MYRIYADGKPLHAPHLVLEGCGVFSPKLTVEMNKAGSLNYTMPPNNALYDEITKLKTIITVYDEDEELFRGRVLNDEKDFYNQKKTYCEGELSFLVDTRVRPYSYSGNPEALLKKYISEHNSKVEPEKRFTVGVVNAHNNTEDNVYWNTVTANNESYPSTLDEINEKLIGVVGGYLKIRSSGDTRYIDWLYKSGEESSQIIEFGVNLLDITEHITAENVFTVLIPLGATLEDSEGNSTNRKLTVADANNGSDRLINETAVNLFGYIEHTEEWSDVSSPSELKELGNKLLAKNIEMAITLTLKAVDLHILDVNVEQIRVGDWVRVISLPHKLDKQFQCTKIVYDLTNPDLTEYTFGVTYTSLTDRQVSGTKTMKSSVSAVVSAAGTVNSSINKANQAVSDVENVIAQIPTDYVSTSTFEAYKTEVEEDFSEVTSKYEDLLERIIELEGGTA